MPATAVREKPILFSGAMVRAILDGRKTVTRRVVGLDTLRRSETPSYDWTWRGQAPVRSIAQQQRGPRGCWQDVRHADFLRMCPYGQPGDRLWVRETWAPVSSFDPSPETGVLYRADAVFDGATVEWDWKPSIHMPRWASRLTLEITDVRVERLQSITEADAKAEGVPDSLMASTYRLGFENLWNSIHGCNAFSDSNPWVWVVSFKPV